MDTDVAVKKRTKRKKLSEYFAEKSAVHAGPCTGKKRCPALAAVLSVHDEKPEAVPALVLAPYWSMKTGKLGGEKLVYYPRRGEFIELNYCPFCGKEQP